MIANGQTYFAMQTRRQELKDDAQFALFNENGKRLAIRNELAVHNKHLTAAAKGAGVATPIDYAIFQDHGYRGLYGGLGAKDIHARKDLKKSQEILDHMGSTASAANKKPTKRILRVAQKSTRRLLNWVKRCQKNYPRRSLVLSK